MDHQLPQSWIEQLVEEEMEVIVQEIKIFAHSRQIFAEAFGGMNEFEDHSPKIRATDIQQSSQGAS